MHNLFETKDVFEQTNEAISHYAPTIILIVAVFAILGFIAYRLHYHNNK